MDGVTLLFSRVLDGAGEIQTMTGKTKGSLKTEYLKDYIVFDLETTGISCKKDRIIEISAIRVEGGAESDSFSTLVNPGCPIPFYASQVNGITDDMVEDAPFIEEVLPRFLDFIGDLPLVGHNIHSFDMKFIYRECERCCGKIPGNDYVDTLKMSRICLPELSHHTLSDVSDHFGISTKGAHRALNDCKMNLAVYERLGTLLQEKENQIRK